MQANGTDDKTNKPTGTTDAKNKSNGTPSDMNADPSDTHGATDEMDEQIGTTIAMKKPNGNSDKANKPADIPDEMDTDLSDTQGYVIYHLRRLLLRAKRSRCRAHARQLPSPNRWRVRARPA